VRKAKIQVGFVIGGLSLCAMTQAALAAPNCTNFFYNMDGSWSPTHPIMIAGPTSQTMIVPADEFRRGMPGLPGRIAASLSANCRFMVPSTERRIPRVP
jgi:hypothetical protein